MSEPNNSLARHQYAAFLDQLPADWEQKEIAQIGTIVGGGTPSRDVPSFWRGSIPWVTPGEVSGEGAKLLHDTNDHISASGLAGSGANLLPAGALLVTTRATLGARVINAVPMATNQGFKSVVFKKPEEASYYFHLFEKVKPELVRRASGTTFLEISGAEFACIKVPSPLTSEKLKISQILDTLDTAIHETEAIIAKLKAVKQGLLHDLLTRGIAANGELRPPQAEAPHLYKESPLGWIPKEWNAHRFEELADYSNGKTFDAAAWSESGLPIIRIQNLNGSLDFNCYVGKVQESWHIQPGDLLFAWAGQRGSSFGARIWKGPEGVLNQHIFKVSPRDKLLSKEYLFRLFRFRQTAIEDAAHGFKDSFLHVTKGELGEIYGGVPTRDEQELIEERIASFESKLLNEELSLQKLRNLKSGLMDDLLNGRVRVALLLAEAAEQNGSA